MAYSLLQGGQLAKKEALHGLKQSAQEEANRNIANDKLAQAEKTADKSVMATGATLGAMQGINAVSTAGTVAAEAASAAGMAGAGTAQAGLGAAAVGGAATAGIGLIAAWALTELL